jgi:hypothetical protein
MATDKGLEDIEQSQIESNYDETVDSFDEMDLRSELLRGKMRRHEYILYSPSSDESQPHRD